MKTTTKHYIESGYAIVDHRNTLYQACARIDDIVDFIRRNKVKVPKRAWISLDGGVYSVETTEHYAPDRKHYRGLWLEVAECSGL